MGSGGEDKGRARWRHLPAVGLGGGPAFQGHMAFRVKRRGASLEGDGIRKVSPESRMGSAGERWGRQRERTPARKGAPERRAGRTQRTGHLLWPGLPPAQAGSRGAGRNKSGGRKTLSDAFCFSGGREKNHLQQSNGRGSGEGLGRRQGHCHCGRESSRSTLQLQGSHLKLWFSQCDSALEGDRRQTRGSSQRFKKGQQGKGTRGWAKRG